MGHRTALQAYPCGVPGFEPGSVACCVRQHRCRKDATMLQQPVGLAPVAEMFKRWLALAQARQLPIVDLFNATATLQSLGQRIAAADLYKAWIAFNGDSEVLYAVYFNYGVALTE